VNLGGESAHIGLVALVPLYSARTRFRKKTVAWDLVHRTQGRPARLADVQERARGVGRQPSLLEGIVHKGLDLVKKNIIHFLYRRVCVTCGEVAVLDTRY
jgi:hypothetical protein